MTGILDTLGTTSRHKQKTKNHADKRPHEAGCPPSSEFLGRTGFSRYSRIGLRTTPPGLYTAVFQGSHASFLRCYMKCSHRTCARTKPNLDVFDAELLMRTIVERADWQDVLRAAAARGAEEVASGLSKLPTATSRSQRWSSAARPFSSCNLPTTTRGAGCSASIGG